MAVPKQLLQDTLKTNFPDAQIEIVDLVGDEDHYSVTIASNAFAGLPLIKQHRLVNEALADLLATNLHAVTINTKILS